MFAGQHRTTTDLRSYFAEIEKNTPSVPLRMKFVNIDNTHNISQVTSLMDSNSKTVILVGSLDENFGRAICSKLDPFSKSYPMKILGMPTWDAITDFNAPAYADLEIYYTTPFYMNPADSLVAQIQQNYKTRFYSRPSDMVYRGYETTLHFGQLLEGIKVIWMAVSGKENSMSSTISTYSPFYIRMAPAGAVPHTAIP